MATNYGKQFEKKFLEDMRKVPEVSIDRLVDVTLGYKSISNISDYIVYRYPEIFYMELKSVHGNTFPLTNLTQYDKLIMKAHIKGVRTGVTIWFVDHNRVVYVPITTIKQLKDAGMKSVNIRTISESGFEYQEIPSVKKRVFLDSDYSVLFRDVSYYEVEQEMKLNNEI